MRTTSFTALCLLLSVAAQAEVYKCTAAGEVEYRNFPCAPTAVQSTVPLAYAVPRAATAAYAAAELDRLRRADQALSEQLARERELRIQIAAQQALADQRERIARQAADAATRLHGNEYWPLYASHAPYGVRRMGFFRTGGQVAVNRMRAIARR
jgi:hypothetical protein